MRLSEMNEGPTTVVMDESSKSSLCDDGEEYQEQVGDHLVAIKEAIKVPTENDGCIERFSKDGRFPKRERRPPGEGWKNHIPPQHSEK